MRIDGKIFGKMRGIINHYTPPASEPNTSDPNTVTIMEHLRDSVVDVTPDDQHQLLFYDLQN